MPMFAVSILILYWQIENPDGFNIIWQYFGFANQSLATFALWTITAYMVKEGKTYWVTLVPALFMTCVCTTYLFISRQTFFLPPIIAYSLGGACTAAAAIWFALWRTAYPSNPSNPSTPQ